MELDVLTNEEFIKLATHQSKYNKDIVKEWMRRFEIGYPYALDSNKKIYNYILEEIIEDEYCDKIIVEQANRLRKLIK